MEMAWMISVGRAGAKGRAAPQAVSLQVNVQGMRAQVKVFPNADRTTSGDTGSIPAWQAQRVWQNVLSTLVGT
jgi:hypothetical protein